MSRSLWFAAGAGAGVYAMVRARRLAEAVTVDGLRDRASAALVGVRALREEIAVGRAEKETELRERFGLVPDGGLDCARPPNELARPPNELARPPNELARPPNELARPPNEVAGRGDDEEGHN